MAETDPVLAKLREICLSLPDATETLNWGKPRFRVDDKIFAEYGDEHGRTVIGFKLEMDHARAIVKYSQRFWPAPYVGENGWVSMDAAKVADWEEVQSLIVESYRLIAPKASLAKLDAAKVAVVQQDQPPAAKARPKPSKTKKPASSPAAPPARNKAGPPAKKSAARKPEAKKGSQRKGR